MRWFKEYWFGLFMSVFTLIAVLYVTIIFISPRYDIQRRGFIPCTEKLAQNIAACPDGALFCTMQAILNNNLCDMEVIGQGVKNWLNGKQDKPWSNYIFEPELIGGLPGNDDPDLEEIYQQHSNFAEEMAKLKQLEQEQQQNEQETAE